MRISLKRLLLSLVAALVAVVVLLNWTWGRLPGKPEPPAGSGHVTVDGVRMHYVERPGSGPGVVMIHGQPGTYLDWSLVQDELEGVRTIAVDRPGYGFSGGGYLPFKRQVELIHKLTRQLGLKKPVIAGHSYGGAISLQMAKMYPKDTPVIVPVNPMVNSDDNTDEVLGQARAIKLLNAPVVGTLTNLTFNQLFSTLSYKSDLEEAFGPDAVVPAYRDQTLALTMKQKDMRTYAEETLNVRAHTDPYTELFADVRARAEIVHGRSDQLVAADAVRALAKKLPAAHLTMLDGGHMQPLVRPQPVADAVRRALRIRAE